MEISLFNKRETITRALESDIRGLPLITYASRGGGGGQLHTNAYKGGGGCDHDQNTHFVRRFIENATLAVKSVGSKGLSA